MHACILVPAVYIMILIHTKVYKHVCVLGSFVVALHGSNATFDDQPCVVLFSRSQCKLPHHQVIQPDHEVLDPYV